MKVAGSIALVTGANRGLGLAFARALLEKGAATVYAAARAQARSDHPERRRTAEAGRHQRRGRQRSGPRRRGHRLVDQQRRYREARRAFSPGDCPFNLV